MIRLSLISIGQCLCFYRHFRQFFSYTLTTRLIDKKARSDEISTNKSVILPGAGRCLETLTRQVVIQPKAHFSGVRVAIRRSTALTTRSSRSLVLIGNLKDGHHCKTQGLWFFKVFFLILSEIKCIAV